MRGERITRRLRDLREPATGVPLLIACLAAVLLLLNPSFIDGNVETLLVDLRFKVRNWIHAPEVPADLVVVAVDERSLEEHGRWPWGRRKQAALIQQILDARPRCLAVDIFYAETESAEADQVLADVFARNRDKLAVALGFDVEEGLSFEGEVPDPLYDIAIPRIRNVSYVWPVDAFRVLLPPEPLASAATFGHVYALPDRDGKLRWETLYLRYGEEYIPSLALQTARMALGVPPDAVSIDGGSGVRLGEHLVPTDAHGRLHINYLGGEGTLPYLSASDVMARRVPGSALRDRIVLLGTSAIATYDLKVTPFSANMPGVEKNATVVANILSGNAIRMAPLVADLFLLLALGTLLALAGPRPGALQTLGVFVLAGVLLFVVNLAAFAFWNLRMNLAYPLAMVAAQGAFVIGYRYLAEERRARDIRRIFSSYVTERVVNELIRHPEMTRLGGERREVTVLFSDIRDFTAFSETHDSEEVVSMLNEILTAMTEVIFRWEGTLDKFVGDEIVAFWGAPLAQEDHAESAVRCALHMVQRLGELQRKWRDEGKPPLGIGIGLNTGEVIVGNIGAEGKKMDYTVIGDPVNLGARTEALTRRYGAQVLMTEFTFQRVRRFIREGRIAHCSVRGLERVIVKGKERAVGIYEISALEHGTDSSIVECAEEVIRLDEK